MSAHRMLDIFFRDVVSRPLVSRPKQVMNKWKGMKMAVIGKQWMDPDVLIQKSMFCNILV